MNLFGSSGIRDVVDGKLTPDFCLAVSKSIAATLPQTAQVCIATDARVSRDVIKTAVTTGLLYCGIDVVDFGILPTPALALLTRELGFDTGIMITASHNPPEFNGIKLFNSNSLGYSRLQEEKIENIYFGNKFRSVSWRSVGKLTVAQGVKERYFKYIQRKLPISRGQTLKIVVDPGNGAASEFASVFLSELGHNVLAINNEHDGLFPNRSSEPREDTLVNTIDFLRKKDADLAVCYDGDADRVVFCDREGFLGYNEMVAFISRMVLKKSKNRRVATTVETGRLLDLALADLGGEVIRGKVGDVNVAHLVREHDAAIGVEQVGVYIFPELGYYPDSMYASALLLSQIEDASEIRETYRKWPRLYFSKAKIACPNITKQKVMGSMEDGYQLLQVKETNTLDGLRYELDDAWLLVRPSGTEPAIRVIAEAESEDQMNQLLAGATKRVRELVELSEGDAWESGRECSR
jgi:phosphoglucosamine mutase